jgi:hypothetical protein
LPPDEVDRFIVDGLHPRLVRRPGILDLAVSDALVTPRIVSLQKFLVVLRPVRRFRFLICVEVVKVAEELVEAVVGRQVFVAVTQMVVPELPSRSPAA